jgi:hypothetical protein
MTSPSSVVFIRIAAYGPRYAGLTTPISQPKLSKISNAIGAMSKTSCIVRHSVPR